MSSKYKVGEDEIPHFVTFSVVGWIDVFSREQYKEILVDSFQYCIASKGLILHAWVIKAIQENPQESRKSLAVFVFLLSKEHRQCQCIFSFYLKSFLF